MPPATVLPGWLSDAIQGLLAGDVDAYLTIYAPTPSTSFRPRARAGRAACRDATRSPPT